jgi:hypothetical protein
MKLFVTIYDDARLLPHFLRHYSGLGITEFFVAIGPGLVGAVSGFTGDYNITVFQGHDVWDSPRGGNAAVTEMRRLHQLAKEWVVIVDLDEFVEFGPTIPELIVLAESEAANAIKGIMYDRFSADGQLVPFGPDSDLRELYPVKARFMRAMGGFDEKRVLVKGHLQAKAAHHIFADEQICSAVLEIAHYKWNDCAMERLKLAYQDLTEKGISWAYVYKRMIDHYERNARFNWEEFDGELVSGNQRLWILAQQRDAEIARLRARLTTADTEAANLRDEIAGHERQDNNLQAHSVALSADISATKSALAATEDRLGATEDALTAAKNELTATLEALSGTREELQAVHRSLSWRATQPLRWLCYHLIHASRRVRPPKQTLAPASSEPMRSHGASQSPAAELAGRSIPADSAESNAGGSLSMHLFELEPEDFVAALYRSVLRRPADPAGLAHWSSIIRTAGDYTSVLARFVESDEFKALNPGTIDRPSPSSFTPNHML